MGQKVNPVGMRIGVNREWDSMWYADKDFSKFLHEDIKVRELLEKELKEALLSHVEIKRIKENVNVTIWVARPGVVLGQENKGVEELAKKLSTLCHNAKEIGRAHV